MTTVNFYDKEQTDELLGSKANSADVYRKDQTNILLASKANSADVYTKGQTDILLASKVDNSTMNDYATKTYVESKIKRTVYENPTYEQISNMIYTVPIGSEVIIPLIQKDSQNLVEGFTSIVTQSSAVASSFRCLIGNARRILNNNASLRLMNSITLASNQYQLLISDLSTWSFVNWSKDDTTIPIMIVIEYGDAPNTRNNLRKLQTIETVPFDIE